MSSSAVDPPPSTVTPATNPKATPIPSLDSSDVLETRSVSAVCCVFIWIRSRLTRLNPQVQLEWKVNNLKQLFDSTKGEVKSKCVKVGSNPRSDCGGPASGSLHSCALLRQSPLFDNSRWQIFLYPNSGHEQYVSLYLSAEPTLFEKERGASESALLDPPKKDGKDKDKEKDKAPWRRDGKYKFTFEVRHPFVPERCRGSAADLLLSAGSRHESETYL